MTRYWIHASGDWDELPEEWQQDLREDVEEAFRFLGATGVTVSLRAEDE